MHTLSCLWWEWPRSIFNTKGLPFSDRFWRSFLRLAGDGDILPVLSPSLNRADWWGGWHYNQISFYITLQLRPKDCNNIYEVLHTAHSHSFLPRTKREVEAAVTPSSSLGMMTLHWKRRLSSMVTFVKRSVLSFLSMSTSRKALPS